MCVNFVHATNAANHYAMAPTIMDGVWDGIGIGWTIRKQFDLTVDTMGRVVFLMPNQKCQALKATWCWSVSCWHQLQATMYVAVQIVATCHWQSVNVNQLLQNSCYLWLNMWFIFSFHLLFMPSVLWCCWLGGRKGIRPVKNEWWGAGVVICLEWGADLHMAQLMPLPPTVSCSSKIQIGFTFVVPAHLGSPGQRAVKRMLLFPFIVIS